MRDQIRVCSTSLPCTLRWVIRSNASLTCFSGTAESIGTASRPAASACSAARIAAAVVDGFLVTWPGELDLLDLQRLAVPDQPGRGDTHEMTSLSVSGNGERGHLMRRS